MSCEENVCDIFELMAAPEGNKFWLLRSTHGRNPIFKKPEELWKCACEYFVWVEEHPLYEDKGFAFQGVVTHESFAKMRAMTIAALCLFLDIQHKTFLNYKERGDDFLQVVTRIEDVVKSQKFEGAAAELLNANIIARDLGLTDKTDITSKGEKIEAITGVKIIEDGASKQSSAEAS